MICGRSFKLDSSKAKGQNLHLVTNLLGGRTVAWAPLVTTLGRLRVCVDNIKGERLLSIR